MFCSKCGQKLMDDAIFCFKCGYKVGTSISENTNHERITHLRCKSCNGSMSLDKDRPVLTCPYCGASDLINESDAVTIQRVKSNTYRTIQLEQQKTTKDIELAKLQTELEKARTELKKSQASSTADIHLALGFFGIVALIIFIVLFFTHALPMLTS